MRPCQHCRGPVDNDVLLCDACQEKGVAERPLPSASELPAEDNNGGNEPAKSGKGIRGLFGAVGEAVIYLVAYALVVLLGCGLLGYLGATASFACWAFVIALVVVLSLAGIFS